MVSVDMLKSRRSLLIGVAFSLGYPAEAGDWSVDFTAAAWEREVLMINQLGSFCVKSQSLHVLP